jgi:hypothetical protein
MADDLPPLLLPSPCFPSGRSMGRGPRRTARARVHHGTGVADPIIMIARTSDAENKDMVDAPLQYSAADATLAAEGADGVAAIAKDLEKLAALKDEVNPDYLGSAAEPAPSFPLLAIGLMPALSLRRRPRATSASDPCMHACSLRLTAPSWHAPHPLRTQPSPPCRRSWCR